MMVVVGDDDDDKSTKKYKKQKNFENPYLYTQQHLLLLLVDYLSIMQVF